MPTTLDLFTKRFIQITFVFVFFAYVDQYWHIPHSSWIIITSALIYSGFDSGAVINRAYLRFTGTIVGIAFVVIVWQCVHLDYRTLEFFLAFLSWSLVFFVAIPYDRFMILATLVSDLALEVSNSSDFLLQFYVIDRFLCTAFVFGACIIIEQVWFGKSDFTFLNCQHLLKTIQQDLEHIYKMTKHKEYTRAKLYREMKSINQKIIRLKLLVHILEYKPTATQLYLNAEPLAAKIVHDFRKIVCLLYLHVNDNDNLAIVPLQLEIEASLSIPLQIV